MGKNRRIAHLADYHARTVTRQDEYLQFNKNLESSLREVNPDVIVFCGDLVHSKTNLSPELLRTANDFIIRLANVAPVHIIVGNHDMNLANRDRLDSVTPIVDGVKGKANHVIFYYKKSGLYEIGDDIVFGAFSLLDKEHFPYLSSGEKKKTRTYVALFHGPIEKSVTETGFVIRDSDYGISMFNEYDIALLGDIHKQQFMNKAETIAYSGSLLQQNFGELPEKGYLLWDVKRGEKPKSKFIRVSSDYGYRTIRFSSDDPEKDIGQLTDVPKHLWLRLLFEKQYEVSDVERATELARKQFKPLRLNRSLFPEKVSQVGGLVSQASDYADHAVQKELFRKYFVNESPETVASVLAVHDEVSSVVSQGDRLFSIKWMPRMMKWSNTFSFGEDNYVDFGDLRGITGVFGKNFSGKSSILDTLLYLLYNNTLRTTRGIDVINVEKDHCAGVFEFSVDGEIFRIRRTTKRKKDGGAEGKVSFEVFRSGDWENLSGINAAETENKIQQYVGNINDFTTTTFSPQGFITKFIDDEKRSRKDLLSKFIGLDVFDTLHETAKERAKDLESKVKLFEKSHDDEKLIELQMCENKERENLVIVEQEIVQVTEKLAKTDEELAVLKEQVIRIEDSLLGLTGEGIRGGIANLRRKKQEIEIKIKNLQDVLEKNRQSLIDLDDQIISESEIDKIPALKKQIENLRIEVQKLKSDAAALEANRTNGRRKIEVLNLHDWFETTNVCRQCTFLKDAFLARDYIPEMERQLEGLREEERDKISEGRLLSSNLDILEKVETLARNRNILRLKIEKDEEVLVGCDAQMEAIAVKLTDQERLLTKMNEIEKNSDLRDLIEKKSKIKSQISTSLSQLNRNMLTVREELVKARTLREEIESRIREYRRSRIEVEAYRKFIAATHRDGISYQVVSMYLPLINRELNVILENVVDFSVALEMDEAKTKRELVMYISRSDEDRRYLELASGMEKTIASIALRAALSNITLMPRCDMLVIDEGFGVLDPENLSGLSDLFIHLRTLFPLIIIISHIEGMSDICDNVIMVERNNGESKIVCQQPLL